MTLCLTDWVTHTWVCEITKEGNKYKLRLNPDAKLSELRRLISFNCLEVLRPKGRRELELMTMIERAANSPSLTATMEVADGEKEEPGWYTLANSIEDARRFDQWENSLTRKKSP